MPGSCAISRQLGVGLHLPTAGTSLGQDRGEGAGEPVDPGPPGGAYASHGGTGSPFSRRNAGLNSLL